jgi:hypothetical protein
MKSPDAFRSTRLLAGARGKPGESNPVERLALFTHGLAREGASALLSGLERQTADAAAAELEVLGKLDSAERHARIADVFGILQDAGDKLRKTWADSGPTLRREIFRQLPPYHRSELRQPPPAPESVRVEAAPGLRAFAARLIREATL